MFCLIPCRHFLTNTTHLKANKNKKWTKLQANKQTYLPAMLTQDPQDSSLFFQRLPPEIRLEIYSQIFYSTRLSFGKRPIFDKSKLSNIRMRPAPNSLSVLRVCRRVNDEIGDSWLGQVLFSFDDPETMLDKLADLDQQTLGKLRHMRYSCEHPLQLKTNIFEHGEYQGWHYQLPHILKLLRGLRLDRLTVVGQSMAQWRYFHLDALINHSDGWKELYYLSNNSVMLGFGKFDKILGKHKWNHRNGLRAQQPSTWTQALAARDGPTASVTIYRSTDAAFSGSMISKPATCEAFADQFAEPGKETQYGIESDTTLMTPGEKEKEILAVARRGKGVDYTEHGTSPMMEYDIRKQWPGMTWGQIRYMGIGWHEEWLGRDFHDDDDEDDGENLFQGMDPDVVCALAQLMRPQLHQDDRPRNSDGAAETEVDEHGCPIKKDIYEHVDDYEWGPYHTTFSPDYPPEGWGPSGWVVQTNHLLTLR